jgi:hypothetical protein
MRHFYTDLVGLNEMYHSTEDRTLAYDCQGLQFTILEAPATAAPIDGWARQPGWAGGTGAAISRSVVLTETTFGNAVRRLLDADATRRHDEPQWVNYEAVHQPADRDPSRLHVMIDAAGHPFCLFLDWRMMRLAEPTNGASLGRACLVTLLQLLARWPRA